MGYIIISLVCIFFCTQVDGIRLGADKPPVNASVFPVLLEKKQQPSDLIPWYRVTNSFIDNMYVSGKTPLIILWLDKSMKKLEDGDTNIGKLLQNKSENFLGIEMGILNVTCR